tara:strand:- start:1360 stop:1752 length:393 start_codon:yes stop_codon:yes gene_type:complete
MFKKINIQTYQRTDFIDITNYIDELLLESNLTEGEVDIFVPHTTCGITINENADPDVMRDIKYFIDKLIPNDENFLHNEGNSDSHIKTSFFGSSERVFFNNKKLILGVWQGIYLCEFDGPRNRNILIKIK